MFITSTVLYFGNEPKGYDLHKTATGFTLHRGSAAAGDDDYPTLITAQFGDEGWEVQGITEPDVIEQVLQLVETHWLMELPQGLSAAS